MPVDVSDSPCSLQIAIPRAHAKINLGLEVLGRRPDGLHQVQSLVVPIALHDEIRLALYPGAPRRRDCRTRFSAELEAHLGALGAVQEQRGLLSSSKNLAARAFEAFREQFNLMEDCGYSLDIEKAIPFEAGLGGGSADAAAVLAGLCQHWGISRFDTRVVGIAAALGADVLALLARELCFVEGTGRVLLRFSSAHLEGARIAGREIVLLKALEGMETARAYARLEAAELGQEQLLSDAEGRLVSQLQGVPSAAMQRLLNEIFSDFELADYLDSQAGALTYRGQEGRCLSPKDASRQGLASAAAGESVFFNDFEAVVAATGTAIAAMRASVRESGCCSDMLLCGSGSAVMAVIAEGVSAQDAVEKLAAVLPKGCFVVASHFLVTC